jgi:hypothetical protein
MPQDATLENAKELSINNHLLYISLLQNVGAVH